MTHDQNLRDKIAVVTGAAQGIGRAGALRLAAGGADVAVIDLNEEGIRETAASIEAAGRRSIALTADCTDRQAVEAAFAEIGGWAERIDILFNNVGQSARERASEFWCSEPDTWRFVVDVSLMSTMLCSRQVVPGMRQRRRGRIVNMSSDTALVGDTGFVEYAAAKAGVIGFTRSLARELAPFQVTVNAVCPGAIRTVAHDRLPKEIIDRVREAVPMGWVAEPSDVAHVVAFLASDDSRYITGHTLVIDGGRHMQ